MGHRKALRQRPSVSVSLRGGTVDYQDDRLGISESDYEQHLPPTWEQAFQDNSCQMEGISGQMCIDSTFENFSQDVVEMPRSAMGERPYPKKLGQPAHEGVNNPAPVGVDHYDYPHRYSN